MKYFPASLYKYFVLLSLPGLLISTMMMAQVPLQAAKASPLITKVIDDNSLVTLRGNVHPLATPATDQGAAPDSLQLGRVILVLKSSPARRAALDKFTDDQQNQNSPNYHKWLTPAQYGEQFGVATEDISKITGWLAGHGFQLEEPVAGRNLVIFSGTNAQLKSAFHTALHTYSVQGKPYFANANDPQIPAALADVVVGFSSLNNFPREPMHTKPQIVKRNGSSWVKAADTNPQPEFTTTDAGTLYHLLAPYDLAAIYNIKPLWDAGIDGTGQTIAIVSDSNINPADVDYFRAVFGLPAKKLNILVYGPDPGLNGDENEADLDVQWAGAVARNATIDLVVSANGAATNGVDGAAVYIINNNLATILNVSYGACETVLGTAGNQYYNSLWEQAASQGIAVLVAAGDSGSASCDQNSPYAHGGLRVSGFSSTPYNVSVGGTDFHSTYVNAAAYWNATNDPTTLASVKGYLPEATWNDGCGSPQILAALQSQGVTDTTTEMLCNDSNASAFLTTAAGSGGVSNCSVTGSDPSVPCISGYPKPAWQSGVPGIPNDSARDLPDVSLMAGNGIWGSFYVYCESDATSTGACNVNTALEGAGGTSFAAPIFAGMMALVQQKTASQQGNVNYVLYKLAAAQYAGSNATACNSSTVAAGNTCMFYDITEGGIAVDCVNGFPDCTPTVASDLFGVLPGYATTTGYDLATGLGSINAYNLVEGWNSVSTKFLPTTTAISSAGTTTAVYGATSGIAVNVVVAPVAPATGTPSGDVSITSNSTTLSNASVGDVTLNAARGTVNAEGLPVGTYQLFAHYAGDATFAPSTSGGLSVTISKANVVVSLNATRTSVLLGQNISFSVSLTGVLNGLNPTGTVTFTDTTTGVLLGSQSVVASAASTAGPVSTALVTIAASQLQQGANTITASYQGDSNYAAATITPVVVTLGSAFTTTLSAPTLLIAPDQAGTVTVTVTPAASVVLTPSTLVFSCPVQMPAGLRCSFTAPVAGSGGVILSTLTIQTSSPLFVRSPLASVRSVHRGWMGVAVAGLMLCFIPRRRNISFLIAALVSTTLIVSIGCSAKSLSSTPSLIGTTTTLSISPTTPVLGGPVTLTAQIAPNSGGGSPSGNVVFSSGGVTRGTSTVASGIATFATSSLPIGTQSVTAAYSGDSTYLSSTSAANTVDVAFSSGILITAADSVGDTSSANLVLTVR